MYSFDSILYVNCALLVVIMSRDLELSGDGDRIGSGDEHSLDSDSVGQAQCHAIRNFQLRLHVEGLNL